MEGFAQGCLLSSFFAALMLGNLLEQLSAGLKERADKRREAGVHVDDNDDIGGVCDPFAFIDDAYIIPVFEDALWVMLELERIGPEAGAIINVDKMSVLTGITGESVIDRIPCPNTQHSVWELLRRFCRGRENTHGIKALGIPLGSQDFIAEYLGKFYAAFERDATNIATHLPHPHTAAQLYAQCILEWVLYRMMADVLYAAPDIDYDSVDLFDWRSTLVTRVDEFTRDFLVGLANLDGVTDASVAVTTLPESLNGLGVSSPSRSAVSSFLVPLARSIHYAERRIRLGHKTVQLSPYLRSLFSDWRTSASPIFRHYRELLCLVGGDLKRPRAFRRMPLADYITLHQPLANLQHRLTHAAAQDVRSRLLSQPGDFTAFRPSVNRLRVGVFVPFDPGGGWGKLTLRERGGTPRSLSDSPQSPMPLWTPGRPTLLNPSTLCPTGRVMS